MTNKSSHPLSVQKLVNLLFLHIYKPDGKQYTNKEVGDSVGVSQSSLTRLRDGDQPLMFGGEDGEADDLRIH